MRRDVCGWSTRVTVRYLCAGTEDKSLKANSKLARVFDELDTSI